jgi:hypothetical protein
MSRHKIILFIVCLFGCSFLSAQPKGMLTYTDKINDFVIDYPDNWELQEGEEGIITIFSPYDDQTEYSEDDENSTEENNLQVEEKIQITPSRWDNSSLEDFAKDNFLNNSSQEGFKIENQGTETIAGKEALWYITSYGNEGTNISCLFYFVKMYNKVISFVAIARKNDFESKFKPIYLNIIHSTRSYIESKNNNR